MKERTENLSQADIQIISSRQRVTMVIFVVTAIIFFGIGGIMLFADQNTGIGGIILPIFGIIMGIAIYSTRNRIKKDIQSGKKTILEGEIEEKYQKTVRSGKSSSTYYYIRIGSREISTNYSEYKNFKAGMQVEVHLTYVNKDTIRIIDVTPLEEKIHSNSYLAQSGNINLGYLRESSMNEIEIQALGQKKNKRFLYSSLLTLILGFFVYMIFSGFFFVFYFSSDLSQKLDYHDVRMGIIGVFLALGAYIVWKRVSPLITDMGMRIKVLQKAVVEDKIESNVQLSGKRSKYKGSYLRYQYLVINRKNYGVSSQMFDIFESGDEVQMHLAKNSHVLLMIENLTRPGNTIMFY